MAERNRKTKKPEPPRLAKPKQQGVRSDANIIADLGLTALVVPARPAEAEPPKRVAALRPRAYAVWTESIKRGSAQRLERIRAEPHKRTRAHILRAMEPGAAYIVNDVARALRGVMSEGAVKAHLRCRMIQQGLVERLPAPPGTPHRAPLMHGSPHKDPVRWFYRLTAAGVQERQEVLERDAAG